MSKRQQSIMYALNASLRCIASHVHGRRSFFGSKPAGDEPAESPKAKPAPATPEAKQPSTKKPAPKKATPTKEESVPRKKKANEASAAPGTRRQ